MLSINNGSYSANNQLKYLTMLFPETGEKYRKNGKRKFVKCPRNCLNHFKQTPLKYAHKYGTSSQSSRMVGVIVKAVLLVHFFQLIVEVTGQSPCPNYFRYEQNPVTNEVTGYIEIQSPPTGVALQLSVGLSIAVALPSKYVGRLELARSKEQSVVAVMQGRPLQYKIHFPLPRPIPVLTGLWFNNQLICSGPRATGPIVTSIVLNHTLYPSGTLPLWVDEGNIIPRETTTTTARNFVPTITFTPTISNEWNNLECGQSRVNKINYLVAGGTKSLPGQWPWLAAIFITKLEFEFQCTGSLLTHTHIITAAHCFQLGKVNLPVGTLVVSLGRNRLLGWSEKGSVNRFVAEYRLHPDYNVGGSADSDLAVLTLRERVEYSELIKPICLWSGPTNLDNVVGKLGHVVGWGRDELGNQYVEEARQIKSPIVSQEVCLWSNANFVSFTSNRTFCAGARNGSGPCNGDSGSGFVMYDAETDRYYLRGVVSSSLLDANTMSCDLSQYVVYVDVAKHLDWIKAQIST